MLLVLAAVLLGAGLCGPAMTIVPGFGELEGWARLFVPEDFTRPKTFSVVSGILALWHHGDPAIAALLGAFSIVLPVVKLAVLGYGRGKVAAGGRTGWVFDLAHHAGKFSMLDVAVIAVLVVAVKGMPGGTEVVPGWGLWAFAGSVLLSMIAGMVLASVPTRSAF
ncbi:paraquat-inducible protein A [Phycisphaera mikurensis]|uniref:Paraquat-inducible protein A n=1 Tax=Phycisphaera mikurensis (strain NBRC 102666 / KCTC 22515 / FYK2301M01) TaxID=1142394 RepID=I0IAU2_PHYMF|nr:paraquat-inducible protein A [Phycisphaera mikurensis]MBB6442644.1 paraquat-inducible protein A [Phycisphaera mikurensis]BAM02380.1 hypothetical protein PSMK_02210 [Phycisphaera mikurensis NBRC 102666]